MADLEAIPTLGEIKRCFSVAGELSYKVEVMYDGEPTSLVEFVGSEYGWPVVMVMPSGVQRLVRDPERFGEFGPEWVRRFFTEAW